MNASELKAHRHAVMTGNLAAHLREDHGITDVPRAKQAQIALHDAQDHTDVQIPSSTSDKDQEARLLSGVTRKPDEPEAANQPKPKPAPRRKTADVALPGDKPKPARRTPAAAKGTTSRKPAAATAARKQPAAEKVAANGASPREHNQEVARKLVDGIAALFADASKADQQKVANWLHPLPTGGSGWERYWPKGFPRPTSAGWQKPE